MCSTYRTKLLISAKAKEEGEHSDNHTAAHDQTAELRIILAGKRSEEVGNHIQD